MLLDLIDSQITYRSRTLIGVALAPVRDMALLDPFNPRSVAFQVNLIDEHLTALPALKQDGVPEEPRRLATLLRAELAAEYADRVDDQRILAVEQRVMTLADAIAARYFLQGAAAGRAEDGPGPRLIYDVSHLTRYRYGAPVAVNVCVLRLLPRDGDGQRVLEATST